MEDEHVYGLMAAAEASQKALENAIEKLEKTVSALKGAGEELKSLPAAVSRQAAGATGKAIREAIAEAGTTLEGAARRVHTVAAWWPLIFAVLVLALAGVIVFAYESGTLRALQEVKNEIAAYENEISRRRVELGKMPKVIEYKGPDGKMRYGVEVSAKAEPLCWEDGRCIVHFK